MTRFGSWNSTKGTKQSEKENLNNKKFDISRRGTQREAQLSLDSEEASSLCNT